jgi:N-acetylmuramate 1-kinase
MNDPQLESSLRAQVALATGADASAHPVLKLKGEASSRSYYRVGTAPHSTVLMVMPKDALTKSDEATQGAAPNELPFLNVHRYLSMLGVRVPKILRYDEPEGVMVLEDLTDLTFEAALKGGSAHDLYAKAVRLLARLRADAEARPDASCLAFTRSFDADLYDWEFHHFREWGMEAWSGKKPIAGERAELDAIFKRLSAQLAAAPKGFTHRDYQSRNLMVKDGELVVIDFQDALLGPRQYDLVALLRDSYVELERKFIEEMLAIYVAEFKAKTGESIRLPEFTGFFDLLTVQRKLKDAARFEFIHRVKGNPGFLVSIPASLRYVKAALDQQPQLADLHRLAARYVPELA